jgi:metal-responsive CopG/Arc/MetJ family transcriptional regulator
MKKPMTDPVAVRLAPALHRTFTQKAAQYGGRSEVMRELIRAFCENRLTIEPPKLEGTIYHDNRKDL